MTSPEYKKLREQLGLTQAGLADNLGVSRRTIAGREGQSAPITEEAALAIRALVAQQGTGGSARKRKSEG